MSIAPPAGATTYAIDKDHTTVGFKIRHLFSNVQGSFNQFDGNFTYVPGTPEQWTVTATIQASSIDTNVEKRDQHLRSKDFFDVEQFSTIEFASTEVTDATPSSAKLHGLLTIHGVQKPVVLDLALHGEGKDPWGNVRSGFTAKTSINRKDYGLAWNQTLETGRLLVGEEVEIVLEVEGLAQTE
ncbi:MAG: YceI family protein [Candidatus Omnitrophota bacterium]|nr:YceI family protein [Candidatus Omnitrophota bacterium]